MIKKIIVVGAIPSPIGGISSYLYRYCQKNHQNIEKFIDLYYSNNKLTINKSIKYKLSPKNNIKKIFFIYNEFFKLRNQKIFFNFSTIRALILLAIIPKSNNYWILTLHHGELDKTYIESSNFMKKIYEHAISKVDNISYFSDKQFNFYKSFFKKYNGCFEKTNSYIAIDKGNVDENLVSKEMKLFYHKYKKRVLMSGYPQPYYRYDMVINYIKKHTVNDLCLTICLYGTEEKDFIRNLQNSTKNIKNIKIIFNLNMFEFISLMSFNNFYVRPNDIDSFGIAVADAINLELKVLASDVCQRYDGSKLFITSDIQDFNSKFKKILFSIDD